MTKEDEDLFRSISLPLVKQGSMKSIISDLPSVQPLTIEQAANGRPIKDFPYKLDDFASYEALEAFIRGKLKHDMNIVSIVGNNFGSRPQMPVEWLNVARVSFMQFPSSEFYYRSVEMIVIGGTEPQDSHGHSCLRTKDYHICKLNYKNWNVGKIKKIIDKIKKEHVLQLAK